MYTCLSLKELKFLSVTKTCELVDYDSTMHPAFLEMVGDFLTKVITVNMLLLIWVNTEVWVSANYSNTMQVATVAIYNHFLYSFPKTN